MKTRLSSHDDAGAEERLRESPVWRGLAEAAEFARAGRMISAIKWLETANPSITREGAKAAVRSLGYGREVRWPEPDKLPLRRL